MKNIVFLNYVVSVQGIEIDKEKDKVIREQLTPKSITKVRSFHSLASFYKCFVKDFSALVVSLTEIIKRSIRFKQRIKQDNAFNLLKEKLCFTSGLSLPDFTKALRVNEYIRNKYWSCFNV